MGNGLLISPELLIEDGLLHADDCKETFSSSTVDYDIVIPFKHRLLDTIWGNFHAGARKDLIPAYEQFCHTRASWLDDYALFRALKFKYGGACYLEWPAALDLILSEHFNRNEPGAFDPLREVLLTRGDFYMHLADLMSYLEADRRLTELYADPDAWAQKAILNVASSGKFSSDRTIAEYAADIWKAEPCPVP